MAEYAKSPVDNIITVTSIATVFRKDLRNKFCGFDCHDFPEIFYMVEGKGRTVINGTLHHLDAGQIIIYAPNSPHESGTGGIAEIISFETATPFPEQYCDRVITLTGSQRLLLHQIIEQARPMFEKRIGVKGMVLKSHIDPYAVQNTKNKLELFLLDIIRPGKQCLHDRINNITDYMMENIHRMLTLQEMAHALGMSVSSLKRLVQEAYGKSPVKYFTELKIEEAKRLIMHSPMNMTEIAEKLGYSSVHYFSRTFKQKTGKTPSEYKNAFG
ncbi:MAG: helix-turn-helix transcriptional regulator [Clostridia bacterium]|nr:helix-turn-helix transcriptional regulator [Clostridia bacterium]